MYVFCKYWRHRAATTSSSVGSWTTLGRSVVSARSVPVPRAVSMYPAWRSSPSTKVQNTSATRVITSGEPSVPTRRMALPRRKSPARIARRLPNTEGTEGDPRRVSALSITSSCKSCQRDERENQTRSRRRCHPLRRRGESRTLALGAAARAKYSQGLRSSRLLQTDVSDAVATREVCVYFYQTESGRPDGQNS